MEDKELVSALGNITITHLRDLSQISLKVVPYSSSPGDEIMYGFDHVRYSMYFGSTENMASYGHGMDAEELKDTYYHYLETVK